MILTGAVEPGGFRDRENRLGHHNEGYNCYKQHLGPDK
jgi:hypothetical protein